MKKFITSMFILVLSLFSSAANSQTPTYELTAKNYTYISTNTMEFDVYMRHTNNPTVFEYSGGQYFFNFDPNIANGGTLSYTIIASDLPTNMQPRNPLVSGSQLRLASNTFPGPGFGFIMTNNGNPGTRIVRMRLATSAPSFASVAPAFQWRSALPDPFTKIFAYVAGNNVNISSPATHLIDSSGVLVTVNVKVALEGLYRTILNRHIKRDTVTIILRRAAAPFQQVDSSRKVLDSVTLSASASFRNVANGSYYIVVRHKNSMETWSKPGGENLTVGTTFNYDFTTLQTQAYGSNMKLVGTKWCIFVGNVNQDFIIDASDMLYVDNDSYIFLTGDVVTDLNGDRIVDIDDLAMIDNNARRLIILERPYADGGEVRIKN